MQKPTSSGRLKKGMNKETISYLFEAVDGRKPEIIHVTSSNGERLSEINSCCEDLEFAKDCFELALTMELPQFTFSNENRNSADLVHDALCRAAIMSYARTFAMTDASRCQLGIDAFNEAEMETHKELKRIRDTYIAHAGCAEDSNAHEFIGTCILIDPEGKIEPKVVPINRRASGFHKDKIQNFIILIEKQWNLYKKKLEKMRRRVYKEEVTDKLLK